MASSWAGNITLTVETVDGDGSDPLDISKEQMMQELSSAKSMNSYGKTQASWETLSSAIADAEAALADANATESTLQLATENLQNAINGLQLTGGFANLRTDMFHKWTSPGADATQTTDAVYPANEVGKTIDQGATICGLPSVNYLEYANLTGCNKIVILGTPGLQARLLINRVEPLPEGTEGRDPNGGAYVEIVSPLDENGILEIDLKENESLKDAAYIHLNSLKKPWDGQTGVFTEVLLQFDYSITGELTGGWDKDVDMTLAGSEGAYTLTVEGFQAEAKEYKYKLRGAHQWDFVYQLPAEGDNVWNCTEAGTYNLTFTADVLNHTLTLEAEKVDVLANIAALKNFSTEVMGAVSAVLTLTNAKVNFITNKQSNDYDDDMNPITVTKDYVLLEDASAGYMLEGSGLGSYVKVGDVLNGKLAISLIDNFGWGIYQTTLTNGIEGVTITKDKVQPIVVTDDNILDYLADNDFRLAQFGDAVINIVAGENGDELAFKSAPLGDDPVSIQDTYSVIPETIADGTKVILTGYMASLYGSSFFVPTAIIEKPFKATFTTNRKWDKVYAYAWSGEGENVVKFLGDWPGTELTATEGVYNVSIDANDIPEYIIFNNGDTGKTEDLVFESGKAYEYNLVIPEGTYYVLNAAYDEPQLLMAAGHNWGTKGIVNEKGLDLTFTYNESSNTYNIDTRVSNGGNYHFLGSNMFMDSSSWEWTIEGELTYTISSIFDGVKKYIAVNENNELILTEDGTADNAQWSFMMKDYWENLKKEEGLAALQAATTDAPADATFLIKTPDFNRNDQRNAENWTIEASNKNLAGGGDGSNGNGCAESYHSPFTLSQVLADAPKGVYALTAQGFYRQDGSDNDNLPYFYANDERGYFPVKDGSENSMADAGVSFAAGKYTIEPIYVQVSEAGKLTIGAKLETNTNLWCIWDNFQLKYFGRKLLKPRISITGTSLLTITTVLAGVSIYYTLDGTDPTVSDGSPAGSTILYTGPITLTQNCTVKAIAVKDGYEDSEVATYTVDIFNTYTATFTNNAGWENVYAYAWTTDGETTTTFLGEWPGTKLEANSSGVYTVSIKAETAPAMIIFNDGGSNQTDDLEFVDGKNYTYENVNEAKEIAMAVLPKMKALTESTNVYTEEAYYEYYGRWIEKYEAGTLTIDEAKALQDPFEVTGWRTSVTCDNFLLSAWDTNPDFNNAPYYINTWSIEGENDGSGFKVPFFEYWTSNDNSLGEKTLTATMTGVAPGWYDVTALVRVRTKDYNTDAPYGIMLQANDGRMTNVAKGEHIGDSQFYLSQFTAKGKVGDDGILYIKFIVATDNNISWLAFKNVNYQTVEELAGDVQADNVVDVADVAAIFEMMSSSGNYDFASVDVNNDGVVDVSDVSDVFSIMAGKSYTGIPSGKAVLTASPVVIGTDGSGELVVSIDYETTESVMGWNFSLYLPEGVEVAYDEANEKYLFDISNDLHPNSSRVIGRVEPKSDGGYLVYCCDNQGGTLMSGTVGRLITISLKATGAVSDQGAIKGIALASTHSESLDQGNIADTTFDITQVVQVATPTIVHAGYTLTITTATEGATIYYTLDGTDPAVSDGSPVGSTTLYTGPITLTQNCTVKAIATKEGYYASHVASYDVTDYVPLAALAFSPVTMTTGAETKVTVTPDPATAIFDAGKVSLELAEAPAGMPSTWQTLELQRVAADGLDWKLAARSIGDYTINILYDGAPMGSGTVGVRQQLTLTDGWQWIALQGGRIDDLQDAFGSQLAEARSQTQMVVNDPQAGYWGALAAMDSRETYKVKMNLGTDVKTLTVASQDYDAMMLADGSGQSLQRTMHEGWNWIGNPYQYWQDVNTIFADGSQFGEGDVLKQKTQSAYFSDGSWQPAFSIAPGQGMIVLKGSAGVVTLNSEYGMAQHLASPSPSRLNEPAPDLWPVGDSRFDDNMAMATRVEGVADPARVTLWAFAGEECRGRGVSVADKQVITIHGNAGETLSFKAFDHVTGVMYPVTDTCTFALVRGTLKAPVVLHVGEANGMESVYADTEGWRLYDLQGRPVSGKIQRKGIYICNGKKIIVP